MIFLESFYRPLLAAHMIASIVLVSLTIHILICIVAYCRGSFSRKSIEGKFAAASMWVYVAVFTIGALIYPTFRVRIRAEYFDKVIPWAKALFEIKEHSAAIGLALMIAAYLLRKNFDPQLEKEKLWFYASLWTLINIILFYQMFCGSYLVTLRSIQ
jgi:hypothetical protein